MESLQEKFSIYKALLLATKSLAQGNTPDEVLRAACDALVSSSECVCLAWMYLGNPGSEAIRPSYSAGKASGYAREVVLDLSPEAINCPSRRSLAKNEPVLIKVNSDPSFEIWRENALRYGFKEGLTLPIGDPDHPFRGLIVLFADTENYFEQIGLEPFIAFAQLATVALNQARMKMSLEEMAAVDPLTNLLNRRALQEILNREYACAKRSVKPFSMILIDLDRFKMLNDNYGHDLGDRFLLGISEIAKKTLRTSDWLSRWGGEEFLAILPDTDENGALNIAERLREKIEEFSIKLNTLHIKTSASIGIATYPRDGDTPEFLIKAADAALYEAKKTGRNRVVEAKDKREVYSIAAKLYTAIETNRLLPAHQAIVELKTGKLVAEEALARLIDESGNVIVANDFIPAAMELQLTHLVDYQIIKQTMSHCAGNIAAGGQNIIHFVNISADLLLHQNIIQELFVEAQAACVSCGVDMGHTKPLVLEITERQLLGDMNAVRAKLAPFIDFGMRLAIDDFGSGYSSFQYLADLPVSFLKIEGSLIKQVKDKRVRQIVRRISDIAKDLELITIAEFVEDAETADILRDLEIDWAQGYLFGRPVLAKQ
ncbi:MAG: diguanylate cyclase [Deltaproteobacteria bacterium]|jgi:diguanylate cyclase (GGDEF)-like protein|nr:diguanylate cyclase [Deltaproteobacteria bacterium]